MNNISDQFKTLDTDILFVNSDFIKTEDSINTYAAKLPYMFLNLFDSIEYKTGDKDGKFIRDEDGNLSIVGVTFFQSQGVQNIKDIRELVTFVLNIFGKTDDEWTDVDEWRISTGIWRGRIIFQDGIVFFTLDDLGKIRFELTNYNKFIKRLNS